MKKVIILLAFFFFGITTTPQPVFADSAANRERVNTVRNGDVLYLGRNTSTASSASTHTATATSSANSNAKKLRLLSNVVIEIPKGFAGDIGSVLNAVLSVVMLLAALLVFMQLLLGGIFWITAGGDKGKTEAARQRITSALLGLVVLSATYAIFNLALNFLGFASLQEVLRNTKTITGK